MMSSVEASEVCSLLDSALRASFWDRTTQAPLPSESACFQPGWEALAKDQRNEGVWNSSSLPVAAASSSTRARGSCHIPVCCSQVLESASLPGPSGLEIEWLDSLSFLLLRPVSTFVRIH